MWFTLATLVGALGVHLPAALPPICSPNLGGNRRVLALLQLQAEELGSTSPHAKRPKQDDGGAKSVAQDASALDRRKALEKLHEAGLKLKTVTANAEELRQEDRHLKQSVVAAKQDRLEAYSAWRTDRLEVKAKRAKQERAVARLERSTVNKSAVDWAWKSLMERDSQLAEQQNEAEREKRALEEDIVQQRQLGVEAKQRLNETEGQLKHMLAVELIWYGLNRSAAEQRADVQGWLDFLRTHDKESVSVKRHAQRSTLEQSKKVWANREEQATRQLMIAHRAATELQAGVRQQRELLRAAQQGQVDAERRLSECTERLQVAHTAREALATEQERFKRQRETQRKEQERDKEWARRAALALERAETTQERSREIARTSAEKEQQLRAARGRNWASLREWSRVGRQWQKELNALREGLRHSRRDLYRVTSNGSAKEHFLWDSWVAQDKQGIKNVSGRSQDAPWSCEAGFLRGFGLPGGTVSHGDPVGRGPGSSSEYLAFQHVLQQGNQSLSVMVTAKSRKARNATLMGMDNETVHVSVAAGNPALLEVKVVDDATGLDVAPKALFLTVWLPEAAGTNAKPEIFAAQGRAFHENSPGAMSVMEMGEVAWRFRASKEASQGGLSAKGVTLEYNDTANVRIVLAPGLKRSRSPSVFRLGLSLSCSGS